MVNQLLIYFMKAFDSVRREIFYNTLTEFGVARKLDTLTKISLNENYSTIRIYIHISDNFPIHNGLKQEETSSSMAFDFVFG
jgi:hypothetical protein